MSSYFDGLNAEIDVISQDTCTHDTPDEFLDAVAATENRVVNTVSLLTGDREFPDDLRQVILGIIAIWQVKLPVDWPGGTRAKDYVTVLRKSILIEQLHEAFHKVAERLVVTRFGLLTDNPDECLRARDAHDTTK